MSVDNLGSGYRFSYHSNRLEKTWFQKMKVRASRVREKFPSSALQTRWAAWSGRFSKVKGAQEKPTGQYLRHLAKSVTKKLVVPAKRMGHQAFLKTKNAAVLKHVVSRAKQSGKSFSSRINKVLPARFVKGGQRSPKPHSMTVFIDAQKKRFRSSSVRQKLHSWLYHVPVIYDGEYVFDDVPQFSLRDTHVKSEEDLTQRLLNKLKALGRRVSITRTEGQSLRRLAEDMDSLEQYTVPSRIALSLTGWKQARTLEAWQNLGIIDIKGREFPAMNGKLALFLPSKTNEPAYLLIDRFTRAIQYKALVGGRGVKQACANGVHRSTKFVRNRFVKPKSWHQRVGKKLKTSFSSKKGRLARLKQQVATLFKQSKRRKYIPQFRGLSR